MLIIHKPEIEYLDDGNAKLKAVFEIGNEKKEMWYSTTPEYAQYFCHERGDAFVIPLLFYAMKCNLPVKMEVPISERLYYTITNYIMKAMVHVFKEWHEVSLDCPVISEPLLNAGAVGTGLSCGIDSFSTVAEHISERQPKSYRLTHFTFFNVGGHSPFAWTEYEKTQELFRQRTDRVRRCAAEIGLPIIVVDSNMEEILEKPFASTHTFRNISAVLALQKLFKTYYYSSGDPVYRFNFNRDYSCDYDIFSLHMLSTENLNLFVSGSFYTRLEKAAIVTSFPVSYKYLNVCPYGNDNCSLCEKCLEAMLTLEILGKLDLYKDVFNLDLYRKNRDFFIGGVISRIGKDGCYQNIYDAMKKNGLTLKSLSYYYLAYFWYRVRNKLTGMMRENKDIHKQ